MGYGGPPPPTLGVYRPRHPERSALYRVVERHLGTYLGCYEERFEPRHGPLRSVVRRTAEAYLECGRLQNGFARIRCSRCRGEHLLAFSCRTRNFCPSCQAKRSALLAEHLRFGVLAPVPHRHVVFTIPKALRGLFERERRLLGLLSRCAYETVRRTWTVSRQVFTIDLATGLGTVLHTYGPEEPVFTRLAYVNDVSSATQPVSWGWIKARYPLPSPAAIGPTPGRP